MPTANDLTELRNFLKSQTPSSTAWSLAVDRIITLLLEMEIKKAEENAEADRGEEWNEIGPGTPVGIWLETRREGEQGINICLCRIMSIGDEPEWIEKEGGRTTVTHSTFAAPTHWRWLKNNT